MHRTDNFKEIIVTLFEGHYHLGVAALINSFSSAGFEGLVRIGYKGSLPPWLNQLKSLSENRYSVTDAFEIEFIQLNPDMHFGYYKPIFLKDTISAYPNADKIYYFDPDIIVISPWSFISNWTNSGVALCLDNCFSYLQHNHPWRNEWRKLASYEQEVPADLNYYVNSGFIGINRSEFNLVDRWIAITEKYRENGGDVNLFDKNKVYLAVKTDQDLLNAVITTSPDIQFSIIGHEGMGFSYPEYLMVHAVDNVKPWKTNFIMQILFSGIKPSIGAKYFYQYCSHPIAVFSDLKVVYKKAVIKMSSAIGRFIG